MSEIIAIKYKTRKDYCSCCDQPIKDAKTSDFKEFDFSKEKLINWQDWRQYKEFKEDIQEMVQEYAFETISFFATSSDERVFIEQPELNKLVNFILEQVNK
ncbi:hypothetical protein ACI3ER_11475 [Bacillus sp. Wb]